MSDCVIEESLYAQALKEIRTDYARRYPVSPRMSAQTAELKIQSYAEHCFDMQWKSATKQHDDYKRRSALLPQKQFRQRLRDDRHRMMLISSFIQAGTRWPTAEKIVDDHILTR